MVAPTIVDEARPVTSRDHVEQLVDLLTGGGADLLQLAVTAAGNLATFTGSIHEESARERLYRLAEDLVEEFGLVVSQ